MARAIGDDGEVEALEPVREWFWAWKMGDIGDGDPLRSLLWGYIRPKDI